MSKLPLISNSIFSTMSKMASEYGAVNLSQGFPNFKEDKKVIELAKKKLNQNCHQYTPMEGLPSLLEKIAQQTAHQYERKVVYQDELLITAGATQGIYTAINALVESGDEVLILDPSYDSYEPSVMMAGGKPVRVVLNADFTPNFDKIEDAISSKTRMIIINNPHNPTGKIWTLSDFEALETLLEKYQKILILADEVYEYITFLQPHISFNTRKKLINRTIVVSSFGKSLHITGWKIGYLVAPKVLMKEIKKVHQFLVFSVNSLSQHIISEYLDWVDFNEIAKLYFKKRDLFRELMKESRFELLPCEGTYFQVVDYSAISKKK
jgi:methionine aminotransferase